MEKATHAAAIEVTRRHGAGRAFSGEYHATKDAGIYQCVCCGNELFSSEVKFDSGTGWPGYWAPMGKDAVSAKDDNSLFIRRSGPPATLARPCTSRV